MCVYVYMYVCMSCVCMFMFVCMFVCMCFYVCNDERNLDRPTGGALATCATGGSTAAASPMPAIGGAVNGAVTVYSFLKLTQGASASFSKTVNQLAVASQVFPGCVEVTAVSPTICTAFYFSFVVRCSKVCISGKS